MQGAVVTKLEEIRDGVTKVREVMAQITAAAGYRRRREAVRAV